MSWDMGVLLQRLIMHVGRGLCVVCAGLPLWACERAPRGQRQHVAEGTASVGGAVVSTVAGEPITAQEVQALQHETGLPAPEVLRRLQDRILLMREAEAKGWTGGAEGKRLMRKAAVQSLLSARIESLRVPEEELRAAYERQRAARFDVGERRTSEHVVVRLPQNATPDQRRRAREIAERAIDLLGREDDFDKVRSEVRGWDSDDLQLVVEVLPPVERNGQMVRPFEDALFSLSEPGVISQPVETRFGFHAVRVTATLPARVTTYEDARATLREEAREALRERATEALLRDLERDSPVQRNERVIGQLGQIVL